MTTTPPGAETLPVVRTKTTTGWLWLVILLNGMIGVMTFVGVGMLAISGAKGSAVILSLLAGAVSLAIAAGAFLILQWKKLGFYVIAGGVAANIVLSFLGGGSLGTAVFGAVLSVAVLYYVLQFPPENKAWNHLT